ncbi:hypothetical protein NQ314_008513 [Rhamnusium bicolor]|uniref:Uncharacterized protein n=1 Tax=Rhamnusium bicolor TaxID=1586634 RepID=A0AAV8Y8V3_9CUCU|nr:hypothetical protein NQ314_008513 [Rhamnusium bicolor]
MTQKLAFSDDESEKNTKRETRRNQQNRENREQDRGERNDSSHTNDNQQRQWSSSRSSTSRGRSSEEEELWLQRRNQTDKEMEIVVQRAKQRKEEEEKRFNEERKQGAAKKLLELEEKIQKRDRDNHEGVGTINPSIVPPKPINHVDIPLPEFQKEKERDRDVPRERENRSRTPNEIIEDKGQSANQGSSFRHLTQIEGKNFPRKHQKPSDREPRDRDRDVREQNAPSFSRHFQNDLPPRFLKHQRNNSSSNLQQSQQQYHQFDNNRWVQNNQSPPKTQQNTSHNPSHNRNVRQESPERERQVEEELRDYKRQSSEDSYRSSHHSQPEVPQKPLEHRYEDIQENCHQNYNQQYIRREREEDKWQKDKERQEERWQKDKERQDMKQEDHSVRQGNDDWSDRREKSRDEKLPERYDRERDRPQRPDSRDSRSARHSEPREYMGSWSESAYEPPYEEKRREHVREDRRVVPGPITKERMEAADMRSEKRNLTQLKRGQAIDIKPENKNDEKEELDNKKEPQVISAWADAIPPAMEEEISKFAEEKNLLMVIRQKQNNLEINRRSLKNMRTTIKIEVKIADSTLKIKAGTVVQTTIIRLGRQDGRKDRQVEDTNLVG